VGLCADGSPEPSDMVITHSGRVWRPVRTNTAFNSLTTDPTSSLSVYASQTHQNQQAIISESVNLESSGLKSTSSGYHLGAPPARPMPHIICACRAPSECGSLLCSLHASAHCKQEQHVGRGFSPDALLVLLIRDASGLKPRPT
jgi:hypothetical protein